MENFKCNKSAARVLRGMEQTDLIRCPNPHSWKKTPWQKPTAKAYEASLELLIKDASDKRHKTIEQYYRKVYVKKATAPIQVIESKTAGVPIPSSFRQHLTCGTGYKLDWQSVYNALLQAPQKKQAPLLRQALISTARTTEEIRPAFWAQGKGGRVNAQQPSIQNLPKIFRENLIPIDGGIVTYLDMKSAHAYLLMLKSGVDTDFDFKKKRIYDVISSGTNFNPDEIKDSFLPMINGQKASHINYKRDHGKITAKQALHDVAVHNRIIDFLKQFYPPVLDIINSHPILEIHKAESELFMESVDRSFTSVNIGAFIPFGDGMLFTVENKSDAHKVRDLFHETSVDKYGQQIPCTLDFVA